MSAGQSAMRNAQRTFGFVKSREQIVMTTLGVEAREIVLDESGDAHPVSIDCIDDDGEFGGDGSQIDGRHGETLG